MTAASVALRWRFVRQKLCGMELHWNEFLFVAKCLRHYSGCNFLVFGLGFDSPLWAWVNRKGRTVFLENHPGWLARMKNLYPFLEAHPVRYSSLLPQWEELLKRQDRLGLSLPAALKKTDWDVILVDGPKGDPQNFEKYGWEPPGRMQSIFTASRIVKRPGHVFVHDCERQVERIYSDRYLRPGNATGEVRGRALLRHYRMSH